MERVIREALRLIKPKREERERMLFLAKKALEVIGRCAAPYHAKPMLAGSITRDTWLPFKMEFEVFLLFPPSLSKRRLAQYVVEIGRAAMEELGGSYCIKYAEHPYVSGKVGGVGIDIVPCYEVQSPRQLKSAVDRTPFHVHYLEKRMPSSLSDEVRLLKHFLTVHGMYGADAKTQGYSGYLCELLVLNYGKFLDVLKGVADWRPGVIVDVEGYYSQADWPKLKQRFKHVLIVIDPTDPNRNVASAVSTQNFFGFKALAQQFLQSPSIDFFKPIGLRPLAGEELLQLVQHRQTQLWVLKFVPPDVVPDVLWPQLRKLAKRLSSELESCGFKVLNWAVWSDETSFAIVLLELQIESLPRVEKKVGPHVSDLKNSRNFLLKYADKALRGPYVEEDRWCVEVERQWKSARQKLMSTLSQPLDSLRAKGIPSHLASAIASGFELLDVEDFAKLCEAERELACFVRQYFEPPILHD